MGWTGLIVPEAFGGLGLSLLDLAVRIARHDEGGALQEAAAAAVGPTGQPLAGPRHGAT